jgi:NDP-sugar pyrophosphorylase family protein
MIDLAEITAVILAGGMGTRLREVVADKPKVLAEVNGRPFISYLLDQLADAGVGRVVLCTGYMAGLVSTALGSCYRGMELRYSEETTPLGTGGAVRLALPLISNSPVFVMNGDSYCDLDLLSFINQHTAAAARASLALANVSDISRYGAVERATDNAVTWFAEKGGRQGEGLINAGIYLLEQSVIAAMPENEAASLERDLFPALIGHGLYGFMLSAKFIDIGIPSDYHAASSFFRGKP